MGSKSQTPDSLINLVDASIQLVDKDIASEWSYRFDRNRVHFSAPEREFSIRDRGGDFFTISYGHAPGKTTTRHCDQASSVQLVSELMTRIKNK